MARGTTPVRGEDLNGAGVGLAPQATRDGGWEVTLEDVEAIAVGAGILGTGGGGNPYLGKLQLRRYLEAGRRVRVLSVERVPDEALGCGIGGMGAPTVGYEKLPSGTEMTGAVEALARFAGRPLDFVLPGEIGGANGLVPLIVGALMGLPVVDADPMGRAFPELQMDTFMINGVSPSPFALADVHGHAVIFDRITDPRWAERLARATTIAMGGSAGLAMPLVHGKQVKEFGISGTLSLARRLGQAVLAARAAHSSPVAAILAEVPGVHLLDGKVVDVARRTVQGFARGAVRIEGLDAFEGQALEIEFQNEYLVARRDGGSRQGGAGEVLACTPDLICIVDTETGEPVATEVLRYGLRVSVLGLAAPWQLKTPAALKVVGPRAFGYEVEFRPLPGDLLVRPGAAS
ncbi:DUF917 domain-containing protein [Thermaerobacter marianensis]|nr:DUF917 domain-containing protein [Thermaerobacter marianensis]